MNNIVLRIETSADYCVVEKLVEQAFRNEEYSDHLEHFLIEKLRKSEAFVPELSLVAVLDDKIVGYILFTRITINGKWESLALAPVAVLPEYQGKGIGGALIEEGHRKAAELGYESVILLGHKDYYPRFGYKTAANFDIYLPFDVPEDFCMAIELKENALQSVSGMVEYPKEFE